MKDESLTPKLTIPLFEKVYVTEVYQNRAENLIGIGLKSSVAVIQLIYDDSNATIGYELLHKVSLFLPSQRSFFKNHLAVDV
jgi:hypothetical protein